MQAERERVLGSFRNQNFNNCYPLQAPYIQQEAQYQQREREEDDYDGQHLHPSHSRHRTGIPRMAGDFPTVRPEEQIHRLSRGSEERLRGECLAGQSGREERLREAFLGSQPGGEERLREAFLASRHPHSKSHSFE
jgi:hypothetical protein